MKLGEHPAEGEQPAQKTAFNTIIQGVIDAAVPKDWQIGSFCSRMLICFDRFRLSLNWQPKLLYIL